MTPEALARLHAEAFVIDRPWTAREFAELLRSPHVEAILVAGGFALTRTLAGESELLTLAVVPHRQRSGIAGTLMRSWLNGLVGRAETAFLEVAADNAAARALYDRFEFEVIATRAGYYTREQAPNVDALIMRRRLPSGKSRKSPTPPTEIG